MFKLSSCEDWTAQGKYRSLGLNPIPGELVRSKQNIYDIILPAWVPLDKIFDKFELKETRNMLKY